MSRDYLALITSEHSSQPKFTALVQAITDAFGDIATTIQSMPAKFDIDNAEGDQLDKVGEWVGQGRVVSGILTLGYFGFSDDVAASPFGEATDPSIGGRFYEEGEPFTGTSVMADPEYRLVLKAKIVRNQFGGQTVEIEDALTYIFNAPCTVRDNGLMSIDIVIEAPISLVGQSLLTNFDILPRPAGVSIGSIIYTNLAAQAFDIATASANL